MNGPVSIESLITVNERLAPLGLPYAFLGGAVVGLYLTDPAAAPPRPTKDVDVAIEVAAYAKHAALESRLRSLGFQHVRREGAPICRWIVAGITVDVMPTGEAVFGWRSRWFSEAIQMAERHSVGAGVEINLVTAPYFIATKIEAFIDRGKSDFLGSRDMEDIIIVVDGRHEVVGEIAASPEKVHEYVRANLRAFLRKTAFNDAIPGHLGPDPASQQRAAMIVDRLREIAGPLG
jgi:hypothetical protein